LSTIHVTGVLRAIESRYREALANLPAPSAPVEIVSDSTRTTLRGALVIAAEAPTQGAPGNAKVAADDPDAVAGAVVLVSKGYAVHPATKKRPISLPLDDRCVLILRSLVDSESIKEAADAAGYSETPFRRYLTRAVEVLGAKNRHHAIAIAAELGLLW